jgi:hypothetical protein
VSTHALQPSTEAKRGSVSPPRTRSVDDRERTRRPPRPAGEHELAAAASRRSTATRCGCGCGGSCGGAKAGEHELERARTRNPEERETDEVTTANGQAERAAIWGAAIGGIVAGPVGALAGAAIGYAAGSPSPNCAVASGLTYSPTGNIPVTDSGGRKSAPFSFSASFTTSSGAKCEPRCCEVRQYIKWNKDFQDWGGGPPHSGFPSSSTFDTWYEDRDSADKRYGHRSGPYSDPIASCGDEYLSGTARDMANGDKYCGKDRPGGPSAMKGKYNFQLKVVDVCNSDAVKASSSVITVDWG